MVDEKKDNGSQAGEEESSGFKVTDKRKFSDVGNRKEESAAGKAPKAEPRKAAEADAGRIPDKDEPAFDPSMMEVNFSNFILSLGTSAVLHFGEFPDPATGKQEQNLPMAKHTIDILNMLRDKTTGNLKPEEEKLLSDLLYQLRMKYVSLT
jgi:hypothetical protein